MATQKLNENWTATVESESNKQHRNASASTSAYESAVSRAMKTNRLLQTN